MKIRNISDHVIEKQESGLSYSLQPGEEAPVIHRINAESWETDFPGQTARIYEPEIDGATPPVAPPGVFIIGVNHDGKAAGAEPEAKDSDGNTGEGAPETPPEGDQDPQKANVMLADLPEYTRTELNQIAVKVGIEEPDTYKTKPLLIEAIKSHAGEQNYIEV